jgi:hypothetical protein
MIYEYRIWNAKTNQLEYKNNPRGFLSRQELVE